MTRSIERASISFPYFHIIPFHTTQWYLPILCSCNNRLPNTLLILCMYLPTYTKDRLEISLCEIISAWMKSARQPRERGEIRETPRVPEMSLKMCQLVLVSNFFLGDMPKVNYENNNIPVVCRRNEENNFIRAKLQNVIFHFTLVTKYFT